MKKSVLSLLCFGYLISVLFSVRKIGCQVDTITTNQGMKDGETIISSGGSFKMGFFSPGKSRNRYLGIWYNTISLQTVVWVANREVPLNNMTGILEVINPGLLVLRDGTNGSIIWTSNSSMSVKNPVAQFLDSGNLVVRDANDDNPENYLWQSFDYPADTFLPGMKLGRNEITGFEVYVSSWASNEDPSPGEYTFRLDASGYPQKTILRGDTLVYRTGPWDGVGFNGVPGLNNNTIFSIEVVFSSAEIYYSYNLLGKTISRFTLTPSGVGQRWTWTNQKNSWSIYLSAPDGNCDGYGLCGAYGSCNREDAAICGCLDKFVPKNLQNWASGNWSDGCVRKVKLDCGNGEGFFKYSGYKLPNAHNSTYNRNISLDECKTACLENCSCTAYSSLDITNGGSGCLLWHGDLVDMQVLSAAGEDIYIRMASSELGDGKKGKILVIILVLSAGLILLGLSFVLGIRMRNKIHPKMKPEALSGHIHEKDYVNKQIHEKDYVNKHHREELELPHFELCRLVQATNNFSDDNMLGRGGYGPVYWGKLEDGQEVAVKRLSENSTQGVDEFQTEAICIAKLQHRNLVKLLGCCVEGNEKILVYEYMVNKSLDCFIFDQRSRLLDWPKRFYIIQGIARGILYLHQDSRLRVIHRDLKASNILLDADMNAKISDFGTARSFGGNETGDNTIRVVGTHGYISPEYAGEGVFSVKSDVFSYGVLLLEIVSGRRNKPFFHGCHHLNLLGHVWKLDKEGRALELVDSNLGNSYSSIEVLRAIRVGLLCVQQCPEDRPDMSRVLLMLANETQPGEVKQPGFFMERSINAEITMTTLTAR